MSTSAPPLLFYQPTADVSISTRNSTRPLIALAILQTGLFLVPMIVLGRAIG